MKLKNVQKTILLICFLNLHFIWLSAASTGNFGELYFETNYAAIIKNLEGKDFKQMTAEEQLLYIECRARTGNGYLVLRDLNTLIAKKKSDDNL